MSPTWETWHVTELRFKPGDQVRYAWYERGVRRWRRGTVTRIHGSLLFAVTCSGREDYVLRQTDALSIVRHVDAVTRLGEIL